MNDWYRDFFGPDYLVRYPEEPERTAAEVRQIVSLLGLEPPARILDLACGYGRHAVGLAEEGFEVVGFDLSPDLLTAARRRAAGRKVTVEFVQGDMRELPFEAEFEAVVNVFTSFGYFDDEENRRVLEGVAKSLRSRGRFLLDLINRDGVLHHFVPTRWRESGQHFLLDETSFDPLTSRTTGRNLLISRSGEVKEYTLSTRAYSVHEVRALLLAAGFSSVDAYGGLDGSPFTIEGMRMVFLARRE